MRTDRVLIIAPPGSGAHSQARQWPISRPWSPMDQLEGSLVFQSAGLLGSDSLLSQAPFRAPHHTCSLAGLVGGGNLPRPGEVSLAHGGTLLLDQFTEFRRDAIEALSYALDRGFAEVWRKSERWVFPAVPRLVVGVLNSDEDPSWISRALSFFRSGPVGIVGSREDQNRVTDAVTSALVSEYPKHSVSDAVES